MAAKSNLAVRQRQARETEAPKIQKVEGRAESIRPFAVIALMAVVACLLGYMVYSMVQLNEITTQANTLDSQLRIQQSDSVRLNAQLESQMSLTSIEQYAEQNLGLVKQSPAQVSYINLSQGNAIEIPGGENSSWWGGFTSSVQQFFSYFTGS